MFKRVAVACWTLLAIIFAVLCLAFYSNQNYIDRYNRGHYEQNPMGFLGITQPYVNHFNRGNVFYQLGDYEKAITEYKQALVSQPDETYDCRIRVNYALALVTPIDVDSIEDEDDLEEIFDVLDEAREILMINGCADDDNTGHYRPAQILKNEIDEFEEMLKNSQSPNDPTDTPTPTPQGGESTPTPTPQGGEGEGTPTPTPSGEGEGTPTPTPQGGEGEGTPTPTPGGEGEGTPTPTPGDEGEGTPTPTPGGQGGHDDTMTPEEQLSDIMQQAQQARAEQGDYWNYDSWNFGDYASW